MVTPTLDPKTNGRFGQIDVLAGPDEALYYRVFGRGKEGGKGELRASGPLEKGKPILAFGGGPNMPMTITFQVDKYLPAGDREEDLRAGRASQGPDGQRNRRLPRRDDRERPDQGGLAQPLGKPRPAAVAVRDFRRRGLRGRLTTSIDGRWVSS